ncbi:unnamed protein product [Phaedon cochleariae]|uniref:Mitochondrial cytochrome c oxidase subunit VIc/VIIs domain-containing protein n=1 Tax=Phaedon cochleariae TaxID=80249 RepID=A0A9P0DEU8_PHACE|nr:unnamed protein product [Phaedon cochleariae]
MPTEVDCGKLKKPQMHGLATKAAKSMVAKALLSAGLAGLMFHQFYMERKKRIYRNFYENYDIEKEFERIRSKNVFDSC